MPRRRKIVAIAVPLIACVVALPTGRDYARGATFVIQAAGLEGTPRTLAEWNTNEIVESETTIPWRAGTLRARVYRPSSSGRPESASDLHAPPTLLVPGVHAGGIDEPRLVQFARDISSMGRVVVATELPDLMQYSITTRTTDMVEDAAAWLSSRSGFAPGGRIGLMGISFAGGLSIVAAARPSIRDRVAFVMSFGGHGDLPRTLQYLCTGTLADGTSRRPHDYGIAIILMGVADRVVPADQAQPLRDAILAFLHASHVDMVDKAQAKIEFARARTMAEALGEPARTLIRYINDRDVARIGPILLPHVAEMGGDDALSPARWVPKAPVYLLHGTEDNVIPALESVMLADTLRSRGVTVTQLATPLITHAEVDRAAALRAIWDLVHFWANLLDEE
jgi:dienelactone hydrolase